MLYLLELDDEDFEELEDDFEELVLLDDVVFDELELLELLELLAEFNCFN